MLRKTFGGNRCSRGFTLIAALLLLLLMSGLAISLMVMTNTEVSIGGNGRESTLAYYGAEAGMEKMTSDVAALYATNQAPTAAEIQELGDFPPTGIPGVSYTEYVFNVPNIGGVPAARNGTISSGANQGLVASIIPMTLQVTAHRPSGAEARMFRSVEVALVPVFQFGVFSDSDLSYFPGPTFDFAGRVHTNGNLFLATSDSNGLIFHSKVSAVGEVIRAKLSNGLDNASAGRTGPVYIPDANNGCDVRPNKHCKNLAIDQGSKVGGPSSADNNDWVKISTNTFASWVVNGDTGARPLSLPFVAAGLDPIEIIRRPFPGEPASSAVGQSRLFNQAQIRVLLSDTAAGLHPDGSATDAQDVQLDNVGTFASGVPVPGVAGGGNTRFAWANNDKNNATYKPYYDLDSVTPTSGAYTGKNQWPLLNGFLRVEIRKTDGTWMGVTQEWLKLGFARGLLPPNTQYGQANTVHQNAILVLQMQADRDGDSKLTSTNETSSLTGTNSQFWWLPINFYDAREGEVRDVAPGVAASCAPNGVMNTLEIDVRNLRLWLTGAIGTSGKSADWSTQNGYVLYFSDRRGMLNDNHLAPPVITGQYGFEDTINSISSAGTTNGALEANNPGTTVSPEDADRDGKMDNWGAVNIGDGFGAQTYNATHASPPNPYSTRIANCSTTGRKNRVSGARHVLKLINGGQGYLPTRPDGTGGFTVASENPVYVLDSYNANGGWGNPHAAAAIIADAVTLLSHNWTDANSLAFPTQVNKRPAVPTWYRVAIAAGKNIGFPRPTTWGAYEDYGTDGGLHNFLRYLENWSGQALNYQGSLVSLYYSQYNTGVFKCCTTVYGAPTRAYSFDTLFLDPANLPPGTPLFRDIVNVSYRQDFTPY